MKTEDVIFNKWILVMCTPTLGALFSMALVPPALFSRKIIFLVVSIAFAIQLLLMLEFYMASKKWTRLYRERDVSELTRREPYFTRSRFFIFIICLLFQMCMTCPGIVSHFQLCHPFIGITCGSLIGMLIAGWSVDKAEKLGPFRKKTIRVFKHWVVPDYNSQTASEELVYYLRIEAATADEDAIFMQLIKEKQVVWTRERHTREYKQRTQEMKERDDRRVKIKTRVQNSLEELKKNEL